MTAYRLKECILECMARTGKSYRECEKECIEIVYGDNGHG